MKQAAQAAPKLKNKRHAASTVSSKSNKEISGESTDLVALEDTSIASDVLAESVLAESVLSAKQESDPGVALVKKVDVNQFKLETCTVIVFVSLDGAMTEYPLTKRIMAYSELQREIAGIKRKSTIMYVIQDIRGFPISSKDFPGYDLIRVKETLLRPRFSDLKKIQKDWEQKDYHEVVNNREPEEKDDVSFNSQNSDPYEY